MTIKSIQGLRAIAALLVVCVHMGNPQGFEARYLSSPHPITQSLSRIGYLGVDLFFVISGFIMIVTTFRDDGTRLSAARFLENRVVRVYPPLWVINTLVLAVFLVRPSLVNTHSAHKTDILASYLLLPQAGSPLVLVAWTLVYEVYFYAIFSFALLFPKRGFELVIASWLCALVIFHASFAASQNTYLAFLSDTISFEFLIGMLAGVIYRHGIPRWLAIALVATGLTVFASVAVAIAAGALSTPTDYPRVAFAMSLGAIVLGVASLERHVGSYTPQVLVRIGDGSYAMYLWHIPVITVLGIAMHATHPHSFWSRLLYVLVAYAAVISVGLVVFDRIEKPLTRSLRSLVRRKLPGT